MAERGIRFRGAAGLLLVLAPLLVCLAAEVVFLVMVTNALGWWTVALLIFSTLLGCWLLQREGRRTWGALLESLGRGSLPPGRTADAVLVMVGGLLLIMPGFISDIVGLLLLIPQSRHLVRSTLGKLFGRAIGNPSEQPVVIEGEVVQESPPTDTLIPGISPPSP
ncbi:FxsA family protein [Arachnia propionica]|uniref:FxsA family protein n=1 Tax=Arachnia propionica TaxID=1750 RepID=UPI003C6F5865